jgi:hypothetical protein
MMDVETFGFDLIDRPAKLPLNDVRGGVVMPARGVLALSALHPTRRRRSAL